MTMTLQEAIADLRLAKDTPWTASDVADGHPYPSALAGSTATILNAVASGDLISKADADAAVALVVERAAEICEGIRTEIANGPMPEGARFDYEQAIRAEAATLSNPEVSLPGPTPSGRDGSPASLGLSRPAIRAEAAALRNAGVE